MKTSIKIIFLGSLMAFQAGCEMMSYQPEPEKIAFEGVVSAFETAEKSVIVSWKPPLNTAVKVDAYEVRVMKMDSAEAELALEKSHPDFYLNRAASESPGGVVIILPDSAFTGEVVGRTQDTSFNIGELLPGNYGIKVVAIDPGGRADGNEKVLIYTNLAVSTFSGLVSATALEKEIVFTWNAFKSTIESGREIYYVLYEGNESNPFVFNNPKQIISGGSTTFTLTSEDKEIGSKWYYGLRVQDALGRMDDNIVRKEVIIPDRSIDYMGCNDALVLGPNKIEIQFSFLDQFSEKFNLYRNGILAYTTSNRANSKFTDIGLIEGAEYEYRCESVRKGISVMGSNVLKRTTLSTNAPTFAGITGITMKAPDTVEVTWGVATGVPAQYFAIYANPGPTVQFSNEPRMVAQPSQLKTELTGLGDDLLYSFAVRACSTNDVCDSNNVVLSMTTPNRGAPLSQGATSAFMRDGKLVVVAPWKDRDGGVQRRYVYLYSGTGAGNDFTNYTALPMVFNVENLFNISEEIVLSGLAERTTYKIIVRDQDIHNNRSQNLNFVVAETGDLTAPQFTGITQLALGDVGQRETILKASFVAIPAEAIDPNGASHYQVYIKVGGGDACKTGTFKEEFSALPFDAGTSYTYSIQGLSPRTMYGVCLKARDFAGNISSTDGYLSRSTIDETPPVFDGIQGLAYEMETGKLKLQWLSSTSEDILEYRLRLWTDNPAPAVGDIQVMTRNATTHSSGTNVEKANFPFGSGDLVYVIVDACDNAAFVPGGQQNCTSFPLTSAMTLQMDDIDPPPGFFGVNAEGDLLTPNQNTITVSWIPPVDWADYAGFRVFTVDSDSKLEVIKNCACLAVGCPPPNRITSCDVEGLDAYRTYKWHVRAYDAVGNQTILDVDSRSTSKRTSDTQAPAFNANFSLNFQGGASHLSWNAATDNQYANEPGAVINYKVYRKTDLTFNDILAPELDGTLLLTTDGLVHSDSQGYESGKTYFYTVCAIDASGNRTCDPGPPQQIMTPDLIPPVISSFKAFGVGGDPKTQEDKVWTLKWEMSDNVAGPLFVRLRRLVDADPAAPIDFGAPTILSNADITQVAGLMGPQNEDTYVHYLLTVEDGAQNITQATLRVFSTNYIEISEIKSAEGPVDGDKLVLIRGKGFHSSTTVNIGSGLCTSTVILSREMLTCRTPPANTGVVDVSATNSDGSTIVLNGGYTYCSGPSCTQICNRPGDWSGGAFPQGAGTNISPFIICNGAHLNSVRSNGVRTYKFGDNVDLSSYINNTFPPLHTQWSQFHSNVDGDGYVVTNWTYLAPPNTDFVGLFNRVENNHWVRNLGVVNSEVSGRSYVGLVTGYSNACNNLTCAFENLFAHGTVTGTGDYVGGVIGHSYRIIINSFMTGSVKGGNIVGGVAGRTYYSVIGVFSNADVESTNTCQTGGIFGDWQQAPELTLEGAYATGEVKCSSANLGHSCTGGLIGSLPGLASLTDAYYTGPGVSGNRSVGGLVGCMSGKIFNSYNRSPVTGKELYTGGLVGSAGNGTRDACVIKGSFFEGKVQGGSSQTGGLIGHTNGCSVLESYATGEVTANGSSVGGLIGMVWDVPHTYVEDSYSTSTVSGTSSVGGLVGHVRRGGFFYRNYATGDVTGSSSQVGGFMGGSEYLGFVGEENYATGRVTGINNVGGWCGVCTIATSGAQLRKSYATGRVAGNDSVGGFAGRLQGNNGGAAFSISESYATGEVVATGNTVGGFVGYMDSRTSIDKSYASGKVKGLAFTGGFIGQAYYEYMRVHQSFATGDVVGTENVGGFFGYYIYSRPGNEVYDCYARGNVYGNGTIGGFAGYGVDRFQRIYATGRLERAVAGIGAWGGLLGAYRTEGYAGAQGGLISAFWDNNTTGINTTAGNTGTGLPTANMKNQATFFDWDFSIIWKMGQDGYPALQWQSN